MKRRWNRFFALLTALCLLASLAVVPAAAKTAAECKSELDAAKSALSTAESALETANEAVKKAEDTLSTRENDLKGAEEKPDESGGNIKALREAVNEAQAELDSAQAEAEKKQDAVKAAKEAVRTAQEAYDAAVKAEEEQKSEVSPSSSTFTISESSYSFGKLEKNASGSSLSRTVTISNKATVPMTVSYYVNSGSGFTISGLPATVKAESSVSFTVTVSSTATVTSYSESFVLTADYGAGSYDRSFSVSAEVVESGYSLSIDPSTKDLGKLKEGYEEKDAKALEITVTVQNKGATDLRMNGVKGNDHFDVTAVKSDTETLSSGNKTDYKVVPKKDLKEGSYTDTITFQTKEGATAQLKATIVVEKKLANLTTDPVSLDFGTAAVGYSGLTTKQVVIKNNTDYAMHLEQPNSYSYEISQLSQTTLAAGASVTITVRPRTGLPQGSYNGTIEILANGDKASLEVKFIVTGASVSTSSSAFTDVPASSTFAADIAYVTQMGMMQGTSATTFSADSPITRGQLVTILYRLEGQPFIYGSGFSDVAAGSYCEKSTLWAAFTGITAGNADGTFKPDDPISRQQLATFLYRYSRYKGYFSMSYADLSTFSDVGVVASYAKDAMSWANGGGFINGTADGRLNPEGGATRGQAAAILHRFCTSVRR